MSAHIIRAGSTFFLLSCIFSVHAEVIADSIAEFSNVQEENGWSYGAFVAGRDPGNLAVYETEAFRPFDIYDQGTQTWLASDTFVGPQNNDFLRLSASGGHPTGIGPGGQDTIVWAVRRLTSDYAGAADIDITLRKDNVGNPRGGGITGRVFLDGLEIYSAFIANSDGIGVQTTLSVDLVVGSVLDFAIDPTGITPILEGDSIYSARADGSTFSAVVSQAAVPLPGAAILLLSGLGALWRVSRE